MFSMVFEHLHKLLLFSFQENDFIEDLGPLLEPNAVSFSFDTLGWKVSLVCVIAVMLSIVFFQMRLYFKNKYRRMAIYDLLLRIESPNLENYHKVNYANLILKKVAIQVYGREKVAKMFGEQWLQYLDSKCEKSELSELKIVFENSSYNLKQISDSEFDLVLERTKKWIHQHAR